MWVWVQVRPAERGVEPPGILSCVWSLLGRYKSQEFPPFWPKSSRFPLFTTPSPSEAKFKADSTRPYDMAAISTSSPLISMSPTSTEHDFRFPRRPADSGPGDIKPEQSERSASARTNKSTGTASLIANRSPSTTHRTNTNNNRSKNTADMRGSLKEVRFDLSKTFDNARGTLSKTDAFAGFQDGIAGMSASPSDLGKEDPLAAQVWRFFSKTKQSLPNQERMENLTWRMMHTSLRKQRLANDESSRYGCLAWYLRDASDGSPRCLAHAMRRNDKVLTCHFLTKVRWECSQWHRPVAKII